MMDGYAVCQDVFQLDAKHFNPDNEWDFLRLLDDEDEPTSNSGRVIITSSLASAPPLTGGLSMILVPDDDGNNYFSFKHSNRYQQNHIHFLRNNNVNGRVNPAFRPFDNIYNHVEAQLELSDYFFSKEENTVANSLIEDVILKMQSVFHPSFRLTDVNTRLDYKYIENRPFHLAVLKYIYLLFNRSYYRTALELAKMLMNLDPTDPLAVIFIIDVLAIRCRQYEWLIKAINFWKSERGSEFWLNIKYSYALAHFHLALQGKGTISYATMLLRDAIFCFPRVALHLMKIMNLPHTKCIASHKLFEIPTKDKIHTYYQRKVSYLYAHFAFERWGEQDSSMWLKNTVFQSLADYDNKMEIKVIASKRRDINTLVLYALPIQMQRHLCVIKPMKNLFANWSLYGSLHLTLQKQLYRRVNN